VGSVRIQILSIIIVMYGLMGLPLRGEGKVKTTFSTQIEVKTWADSAFFGGHDIGKFTKGNVEALVVFGSHSSGIPSSETYVFCKTKDNQFKLILTRASVAGILKAYEVPDGIEVRTQKNKLVLFVPWYGIAEDLDYFVEGVK